jgi:hypothetical protein
MYIRTIARM